MKREIKVAEEKHSVSLIGRPESRHLVLDNALHARLLMTALGDDTYNFGVGGLRTQAKAISKGENVYVEAFGRTFTMTVLDPVEQAHEASVAGNQNAKAPMPGVVAELHAEVGDEVDKDQPMLTIESMKLLTVIRATGTGTVEAINYRVGDAFNKGDVLVQIEPKGNDSA